MNTKPAHKNERRQDRLIHEHVHDPYKIKRKLPEPTFCPVCGAVFQNGRWEWATHPRGAHQETCQACQRIKDHYPAGVMTLSGEFVQEHKAEILNLARHHETLEKELHPLNRIMKIVGRKDRIVLSTTDIHLPRRIGEALRRAYKGELEIRYEEETYFIRVNWRR